MTKRLLTVAILILIVTLGGCPGARRSERRDLATRMKNIETRVPAAVVVKGGVSDVFTIAEMMQELSVPGVSLAVIDRGHLECVKSYGVREMGGEPLTTNTLLQAGSVSKPVVAMAALSLAASGKLDLDADVNRYLRSWRVPENEFTRQEKVTLRRLLSHTAGVSSFMTDDGGPLGEAPTLLQILNGEPPAQGGAVTVDLVPGSQQRYSNEGYAIVQQLLIDVEGKPFPQIMKERVLEPLGMSQSTFAQPLPAKMLPQAATGHIGDGEPLTGKSYVYNNMGAGGLWTTPADLAKFVIEIQQSIAGRSNKVLSGEWAAAMLRDPICGHGLGLGTSGEGDEQSFGHSGHNAGFLCRLKAMVKGGRGVVIMTNSNKAIPLLQGITFAVAHEYGWPGDVRPREVEPFDIGEEALRTYAGEYAIGDYIVTIGLERGRLTISHFEGRDSLIPVSDTLFLQRLDGIELTFIRSEQGRSEAISLMDGRLTLTRVQTPSPAADASAGEP